MSKIMGNFIIKTVCTVMALLLSLSGTPLCADAELYVTKIERDKLSPSSRFWRMPTIFEDPHGELSIKDDLSEEPLIDTGTDNFRDDVVFLYMSRLIAQAMTKYRGTISAEGLVNLIEKHLSHLEPFNSSRFEWKDLYRDGNTFCLPYLKVGPESRDVLLMRYYLPEDDEAGLFSPAYIPVGLGDVRVTCDWGEGITDSDALMVYLNIIRGNESLSDLLYSNGNDPGNFFGALFEALFVRLQHDFENTKEFIDICRETIIKEGSGVLRDKIAHRDPRIAKAFLKIHGSQKTTDSSISLYGVIFFFITSTASHIDAMQKTVDDLYDKVVEKGFFPKEADYKTGVERGIYHRGEEIFEAQGRKFSLADLMEWKVPEDMFFEITQAVPEIKEKSVSGKLIYDMGEDSLVVKGWKYSIKDLAQRGLSGDVVKKLQEKRVEMEGVLENFRQKREKSRNDISWALEHLYEEFIETRPSDELSFTKQGVSYHLAGHSIVHLYPKGLIYEGPDAVFMKSIMINYGESIPGNRTWTDNADKIKEALRIWEIFDPLSREIRERFRDKATVVELDMDTMLLFSDPDKNVVRPLQMGRSRHVFYLSKVYLDGLDIDNEKHMRELAFLMKLGESFLHKHESAAASGADPKDLQGAVDDFNLHFLEWTSNDPLVEMRKIRRRLSEGMKLDFIEKNTNSIEEILKDEEEVILIQNAIDMTQRDFSAVRSDIRKLFWLNYSLLSRYSGMGMSEMADKTYRRLKKATKDLQGHDRAGLMPYDFQVKLVFTALKFGYWEDFVNEAETLLTGRNFPSGLLGEEKAFVRSLVSPVRAEGARGLEDELMKALRAQISVMAPGNAREIENRIEEFIEESKELEDAALKTRQEREDDFDRMVSSCRIIDLEEICTRDEVFDIVAEEASSRTGLPREEILDKFLKRESQGSTVVGKGMAIPHIALGSDKNYEMIVVRAKNGIVFPGSNDPVRAMFVLMGPRGEEAFDSFHLKMMMAVALIGYGKDFMENWLDCEDEDDLRLFLLSAERRREPVKKEPDEDTHAEMVKPTDTEVRPRPEDKKIDHAVEVLAARDFVSSLISGIESVESSTGKLGGKIVVGIDMSLMPDSPEHLAALQGLINRISYISRLRGLGDVVVRRRKGARQLAEALKDVRRKTGSDVSNFVILGDVKTLEDKLFDEFRMNGDSSGAFFAGVAKGPDFNDDSYRRIVEMLAMAINAAFGIALDQSKHPNVKFSKIGERHYVFVPDSVRFDPKVYLLQKKEIDTRA